MHAASGRPYGISLVYYNFLYFSFNRAARHGVYHATATQGLIQQNLYI